MSIRRIIKRVSLALAYKIIAYHSNAHSHKRTFWFLQGCKAYEQFLAAYERGDMDAAHRHIEQHRLMHSRFKVARAAEEAQIKS